MVVTESNDGTFKEDMILECLWPGMRRHSGIFHLDEAEPRKVWLELCGHCGILVGRVHAFAVEVLRGLEAGESGIGFCGAAPSPCHAVRFDLA